VQKSFGEEDQWWGAACHGTIGTMVNLALDLGVKIMGAKFQVQNAKF